MKSLSYLPALWSVCLFACNTADHNSASSKTYPDVKVAGAMKNVMWQGELHGIINLGTITNKEGLYGLGPESYLTGELLINDGHSYVSRVLTDTTMRVEETFTVEAPFFVYANVSEWKELDLPETVTTIGELEAFLDQRTRDYKRPFAFKLTGTVATALIHIQNLPKGKVVRSPAEAHQGQTNFTLESEEVEIIGFFSTGHQGIFTHHDSFLHMHLITNDRKKMGHLDQVEFESGKVKLFLPIK